MKKFIQNLFTTTNQISLSVLRIPVGLIFAAHGAQKLFAWFGGYGIQGTGQWLDSIGLGPGCTNGNISWRH